MKSKRAEEAIERYRKKFTAGFVTKNEVETVKEYCRLFTEVVELAEQDAEEKIEALKARAVEAHRDCCMFRTRKEPLEPDDPFLCEANYHMQGELCDQDCGYMQIFIQKLNER